MLKRLSMIGVTGATGEIGGRVARRLTADGVPHRLIVRDMSKAAELPSSDMVQVGGYDDAGGMRRACEGVSTLFLVSAREARDRVEQHRTAIDAAVAAGVERIVYLSFIGAAANATFTFARDHFHTEDHIRKSGVAFTFSRQNLYMDILPYIGGEEGVIRGPAGVGRVAPVLRDDVANAAAAMLAAPGHEGKTYELTGPRARTLGELAALLSKFGNKTVTYENESLGEAYASRATYGAPEWEVEGWVTTYSAINAGELDVVTDHVEQLTGNQPVDVVEFLSTL